MFDNHRTETLPFPVTVYFFKAFTALYAQIWIISYGIMAINNIKVIYINSSAVHTSGPHTPILDATVSIFINPPAALNIDNNISHSAYCSNKLNCGVCNTSIFLAYLQIYCMNYSPVLQSHCFETSVSGVTPPFLASWT